MEPLLLPLRHDVVSKEQRYEPLRPSPLRKKNKRTLVVNSCELVDCPSQAPSNELSVGLRSAANLLEQAQSMTNSISALYLSTRLRPQEADPKMSRSFM